MSEPERAMPTCASTLFEGVQVGGACAACGASARRAPRMGAAAAPANATALLAGARL
jgi:hypothetical protein